MQDAKEVLAQLREEIWGLRRSVSRLDGEIPEADVLLRVMDSVDDVINVIAASDAEVSPEAIESFVATVDASLTRPAFNGGKMLDAARQGQVLRQGLRSAISALVYSLDLTRGRDLANDLLQRRTRIDVAEEVEALIDRERARNEDVHIETAGILREVRALSAATQTQAEEARSANTEAQRAAGKIGAGSLAAAFSQYAQEHLRTANRFRNATIALLSISAIAALVLVLGVEPDWTVREGREQWEQAAYRLALIAALVGLAGYLGRQAGNHRRLGEWGHSISIQLRNFGSFIERLDNETRHEAYLSFARRVLGASPDASRVDPTAAQPLVDLIAKR
ncbi:hypothetical protein CBF90_09790 [Microbacterium sp. AISO3]|uniref:hypothetical protein n=1 Tax=Microbacterium sp. AISO3 TaxID=2002831 RepID=UPI000B4CFB46|nr:hypothetical protein [Microbacterium sp. AISO3]OWP21962.1 hypothetical protein CBF90_09790 [Microbacterium sp. AISO3]